MVNEATPAESHGQNSRLGYSMRGHLYPRQNSWARDATQIISDYLGTPIEAYDEEGQRVWPQELDIYGRTRSEVGEVGFIPFLYQGQYLD